MSRKILLPAGACMTVLLLVAYSHVRGDSSRSGHAPNERVTIDGRSFLPGDPDQDDFSAVRREFEKFGVEGSPEIGGPTGAPRQHPVFRSGLVGTEDRAPGDPPALPQGLTADHTLRLESPTGVIDLVLGKMHSRGPSIRTRLVADGWEGSGQGEAAGSPWLLEKRNGKEATVVCLDEEEGTFLLLREAGR